MQEEKNATRENDEEISLVDIVAVCLRYRKLIIGLPAVAVVVAAVALYALPLVGLNLSKTSYTAQISSSIDQLPLDLKDYVGVDVVTSLNAAFSSVPLVKEIYTKYFPAEVQGLSPESLNSYIQKNIVGNLKYTYDKDLAVYTVRLKIDAKEKAQGFFVDLWDQATAGVHDRIDSELASAASIMKKQIDATSADGKNLSSSIANSALTNTYQRLIVYQTKPKFPFSADQATITLADSGQSRLKTLILVFFAGLFVALLGAFVLNAVRHIRDDPSSMAKIREALGKTT